MATGAYLHTIAILQASHAEVLKETGDGGGVTPEAVKELRRAADLALRATKHTVKHTSGFLSSELCRLQALYMWEGMPSTFPNISIPWPRLYGLIRSRLHARGCCELSSSSARFMSLPSGGRSERGPHIGIPWYISLYLCRPPSIPGGTCRECRPGFFVRSSSVTNSNLLAIQRGFCPAIGSLFHSKEQ